MKQFFVIAILFALLLGTCSRASSEEQAMQAAQQYYEALLRGDCEAFLKGRCFAENLPPSYREQLVTAYQQFLGQQQQHRGGISGVTAARAAVDSTLSVMQVFLVVDYADSTSEEIVVPMVEQQGKWKMK